MRILLSIALATVAALFAAPIGAQTVSGSVSIQLGQLPSFTVPVQGVASGGAVSLVIPSSSQTMPGVAGAPFGPGAGGGGTGTTPTSPRTSTSGATWALFRTTWFFGLPPFCTPTSPGPFNRVLKLGVCRSGSDDCDNHALITAPISSSLPLWGPCYNGSGPVVGTNTTLLGTAMISHLPWVTTAGTFIVTGSRGTALTGVAFDNRTSMGSMGSLQYVSPMSVSLAGYGTTTPGLLTMNLTLAPEPGGLSMLLSGVALVAVGGWLRGRSQRR